MFNLLNDIGWWFSVIVMIGAIIFYIYEKHNREN